jgi:hypothetical protein
MTSQELTRDSLADPISMELHSPRTQESIEHSSSDENDATSEVADVLEDVLDEVGESDATDAEPPKWLTFPVTFPVRQELYQLANDCVKFISIASVFILFSAMRGDDVSKVVATACACVAGIAFYHLMVRKNLVRTTIRC